MTIPASKDEIRGYMPPSLKNLDRKIAFRLRPATSRDLRRFRQALAEEGLVSVSKGDIRETILSELEALSSADVFQKGSELLRNVWASLDQKQTVTKDKLDSASLLTDRTIEASPKLRRLLAQAGRFNDDMPKIALSCYLTGYSGLETPFQMADGVVPLETIDAIEDELVAIEEQAVTDKVEGALPGKAFVELQIECFNLLGLTEREEKNSERPAPSDSTPNGSGTDGQASPNSGSSTTSGTKTRSRS